MARRRREGRNGSYQDSAADSRAVRSGTGEALDRRLLEHHRGQPAGAEAACRRTSLALEGHLDNLFKASEVVNLEDGAERRSLRLCTPGLPWRSTTETIQASVQMVLPGEVARAHRHSAAALRFVSKAAPDIRRLTANVMSCSRAICAHPAGNLARSRKSFECPIVWLDVFDFPFVRMLNGLFFELNDQSSDYSTRGSWTTDDRAGASCRRAFTACWRGGSLQRVRVALYLEEIPIEEADLYDGVTLEFVNLINGGATLPTMQCRMHRLLAGLQLGRHRHTWNTVVHVVSGRGRTVAGDKTLTWEAHDTFSVPSWIWHQHQRARRRSDPFHCHRRTYPQGLRTRPYGRACCLTLLI